MPHVPMQKLSCSYTSSKSCSAQGCEGGCHTKYYTLTPETSGVGLMFPVTDSTDFSILNQDLKTKEVMHFIIQQNILASAN